MHLSYKTQIFTDGSCLENPGGKGGWGVVCIYNNQFYEFGGNLPQTTNNRAEMTAFIMALKLCKKFKEDLPIDLHTDSKYCSTGYNTWLPKWQKRNWKKSDGTPVLNIDLWEEIDSLRDSRVTVKWVRGHSHYEHNDRADYIAKRMALGLPVKLRRGEK